MTKVLLRCVFVLTKVAMSCDEFANRERRKVMERRGNGKALRKGWGVWVH